MVGVTWDESKRQKTQRRSSTKERDRRHTASPKPTIHHAFSTRVAAAKLVLLAAGDYRTTTAILDKTSCCWFKTTPELVPYHTISTHNSIEANLQEIRAWQRQQEVSRQSRKFVSYCCAVCNNSLFVATDRKAHSCHSTYKQQQPYQRKQWRMGIEYGVVWWWGCG